MRWPFVSRRERLRREAADWIARLNGPNGEQDRAAFRRWHDSDPEHAQAYDRLFSLFQTAGTLSRAEGNSAVESEGSSRSRPLRYAFAAAVAFAALVAFALLSARTTMPVAEPRQQFATFATVGGETILIPPFFIGGSDFPADSTALVIDGGNPDLRPERPDFS